MPTYEYYCEANQQTIEVSHSIREKLETWGEVCSHSGHDLGGTPPETPVKRLISRPIIRVPLGDSKLKNLGMTKLVRRDKGVYENVTAHDKEKRYVKTGDTSSLPDFKKRNLD